MKPLDVGALSWNDFVANAVFFLIDVVLLSILVPTLLHLTDNIKWGPARRKIGERSAHHLDMVKSFYMGAADLATNARLDLLRAPDFDAAQHLIRLGHRVSGIVAKLSTDLENRSDEHLNELQLLSPSFNSQLAVLSAEFYESAIGPRSTLLGYLNLWALEAMGGTVPDTAIPPKYASAHRAPEIALERLCQAAGVRTQRANGRLTVPVRNPKPGYISRHYPNHDTILHSLERIGQTLTAQIPLKHEAVPEETKTRH